MMENADYLNPKCCMLTSEGLYIVGAGHTRGKTVGHVSYTIPDNTTIKHKDYVLCFANAPSGSEPY